MIDSNYFCILPWIGTHIEADGRVRPCCVSAENKEFGNLNENPLCIILNSDEYKCFRREHLEGKQPKTCQNCYSQESAGYETIRNYSNNKYKNEFNDKLKSTLPDGTLINLNLITIDIRFSNLCNFKCRTCYPGASSAWYSDSNQLTKTSKFSKVFYPTKDKSELFKTLENHLPTLKEIYILGGEPLLEKDHYDFLDILISQNHLDIELRYSTNLSILKFGQKNITDFWAQFKNVTLLLSYDGINEEGEFIRKGMDWKKTVENHKYIQTSIPHVKIYICPTVSVLNAFHILKLITFLIKEKMITSGNQIQLNFVVDPSFFSIKILSNIEKILLKNAYINFINNELPLLNIDTPEAIESLLHSILLHANSSHDHNYLSERKKFVLYNHKLNLLRKENLLSLFPELSSIFLDSIE